MITQEQSFLGDSLSTIFYKEARMKFNKTAVQRELDLAAEELEKAGHKDLAARVDYYGSRLINATVVEVPLLQRAIARILVEAKKCIQATEKEEPKEEAKKAQAAVMKTRRVSTARKETLKKRLQEIIARRKVAKQKLEVLRVARQERTANVSARREKRQERLEKE